MKPIKFKHHNIVYAKDQKEYMPLPALKIPSKEGQVITCWKLTFKEKMKVLFTGKVWLNLWTFNKDLQPQYVSIDRRKIFDHPDDYNSRLKRLFRKRKKNA